MKILDIKGITKRFPGVLALDNVSLEACEGEILGLIGENGAGKSTLMKILSGMYPVKSYEGEIYVNGKKAAFLSPADAEKSGIEMIYQEVVCSLDLSVGENLMLGNWPRTPLKIIDWRRLYDLAAKSLEQVGLTISPGEKMRNLSTSQQQMVAIAKALQKNPKILIMDEPTSSLTVNETKTLFDILRKMKQSGICIILITHKLDEVFENTDRIVVMRDGKVVGRHNCSEVTPEQVVTETVGRKLDQMYPSEENKIGDTLLQVSGFTVKHPINYSKNILEDISFTLRRGEILGIAGLVGAGRSELLNAMFGIGGRVSGSLAINGRRVVINSPLDAIRNGMALLTEDRKKDGNVGILSIKKNITLANLANISFRGVLSKKREEDQAIKYFNSLGIKAPGINTAVNTLSGGNQQKVVLAKWLMTNPQILFMDEPTRGIDVGAKSEIYKIIKKLAGDNRGILMVSSELPELMALSDRILILSNGKLQAEINRKDFCEEKIMNFCMGLCCQDFVR